MTAKFRCSSYYPTRKANSWFVSLDGQSLRRALNQGENFRTIVSAWATESGLLLGQRKVADKSNEITAVPELLRVLELAGCIVTADAMQRRH